MTSSLLTPNCSSVATLLQLGVSKEDVMVPEREGADQEGLMP